VCVGTEVGVFVHVGSNVMVFVFVDVCVSLSGGVHVLVCVQVIVVDLVS
jgi:hypothetical protein